MNCKPKTTSRRRFQRHNREGITLLFVISMVVLFLLMGTTFVVVANDYFKSARRRSRLATNVINNEALLDRAFYQLMREVRLDDNSSPLRGHSILADQYGYGQRSIAATPPLAAAQPPSTAFVNVQISAAPMTLTRVRVPGFIVDLRNDPEYYDGNLTGQVFSVTSGALSGVSVRIVNSLLMLGADAGGANDTLIITLPRGTSNWTQLTASDEVLINGRDFGGIGAGALTGTTHDLTQGLARGGFDDVDPTETLGVNALEINQQGIPLNTENFDAVGYEDGEFASYANCSFDMNGMFLPNSGFFSIDNGPNEPYDIPDFQNMFLSGIDRRGNPIPSFHRDSLYSSRIADGVLTGLTTNFDRARELKKYTLRPLFLADGTADDGIAVGSTANFDFYETYTTKNNLSSPSVLQTDGTVGASFRANATNNLDVDSDGDGDLDSVWIDIGLPTQTDRLGRRFRPLVAYRVIDMDGRLNVNAAGSLADAVINTVPGTQMRIGSGYGPSDLSLRDVVLPTDTAADPDIDYYQEIASNRTFNVSDDNRLKKEQKLFGYPDGSIVGNINNPTFDVLGGHFATASNLIGQFQIANDGAFPNHMPGIVPVGPLTITAGNAQPVYGRDFSVGGGTGSDLYEPQELEALLRLNDADSNLLTSRLLDFIDPSHYDKVTTNSFEVSTPATVISLGRRLNQILIQNNATLRFANSDSDAERTTKRDARSALIAALLPRDLRLGGKLNINRPLGNGVDDGGRPGAVDDLAEAGTNQQTTQKDNPVLNLDNAASGISSNGSTGDLRARHLLAKDIYITFLLACGDRAPVGFAVGTPTGTFPPSGTTTEADAAFGIPPLTPADQEYRKMVAQFAVNVVDYRDPDSIMTAFEFDLEPFDAGGWEVDGLPGTVANNTSITTAPVQDRMVVWGAERTDLLITETFAFHDRQALDSATDSGGVGTLADGDLNWDSRNAPISIAAFELYNPWISETPMYSAPLELGTAAGINLGQIANGDSPVWRIGLKRLRSENNVDIIRTIYFANPNMLPAGGAAVGNEFYPSTAAGVLEPGAYVTFAPSTPPTIDGQPFSAAGDVVSIDMPRALSISDPDGGYIDPDNPGDVMEPGQPFMVARDIQVDTNTDDIDKINTNGIVDNFRYVYLQRLADPGLSFNAMTNPYITVDSMTVDLLSSNSLADSSRGVTAGEVYGAMSIPINDSTFQLRSTERGEVFGDPAVARRNLFAVDDGEPESSATESPTPVPYVATFGAINASYGGTTPFGCLTWNNRPFVSAAEIANVPYLPSGLMTYMFNEGARPQIALDPDMEGYFTGIMPFFGEVEGDPSVPDDGNRHLLRFSNPLSITPEVVAEMGTSPAATVTATPTPLTANRFARLFDHIETSNLFLGSERWLSANGATTGGTYPINFYPPFHFIPEFRVPGKVNINTIVADEVWNSVNGGFSPVNFRSGGGTLLRGLRDDVKGPTDFAGVFTSSEGKMFIPQHPDLESNKGSAGTMFTVQDPGSNRQAFFDANNLPGVKENAGNAAFRNEFRQRMSNLVTTRSSVFSIWITLGYFEIDDNGRIGVEIGSEEGDVKRDRAFFMVDRSIPVAFEPGRNHNIDRTILTRTIIE